MADATRTQVGALDDRLDSANFPGVVTAIEEQAYLMLYEETLMPKLVKPVAQGQKGTSVIWPYFDPTQMIGHVDTLVEASDLDTYHNITNATVVIESQEFGIASFLTDTLVESGTFNFKQELARQQGIAVANKVEDYLLGVVTTSATDGGFTDMVNATDPDAGLTFTKIAVGKTLLDAKLITVPNGEKNLVIPEFAYFKTAQSTYGTSYNQAIATLGNPVLEKWHINTLFGDVRVFRDNHIHISGTTSLATCAMFVKDAVGMWTPRDYRLEPQRFAKGRGDAFVSTMRMGAKVLVPSFGVRYNVYAGKPE